VAKTLQKELTDGFRQSPNYEALDLALQAVCVKL